MTDFDKRMLAVIFWPTAAFGVVMIAAPAFGGGSRPIYVGVLLVVAAISTLPRFRWLSMAQQFSLATVPVAAMWLGEFIVTGHVRPALGVATAVMVALVIRGVITHGWSRHRSDAC